MSVLKEFGPLGFGWRVLPVVAVICLPAAAQTVVNVPPEPAPQVVVSNTTINLFDGGVIPGLRIGASDGSVNEVELNILGGAIETELEVLAGARVNIDSGVVRQRGSGGLQVFGGEVNFTGGVITGQLQVGHFDGGVFHYRGGLIGQDTELRGGSFNVYGGEFLLDGQPVEEFEDAIQFDIPDGSALSGTLADGTPFAFSTFLTPFSEQISPGVLTLHRAPVPEPGPSVIDVPAAAAPPGLRAGQTLNVHPGGMIDDIFTANPGSTVNINGGSVGDLFEAVGATVNISDGAVGGAFSAVSESIVNVSGGSLGNLNLASESRASVTGGIIGAIDVRSGSTFEMENSEIINLRVFDQAEAVVLGGDVQGFASVFDGGALSVHGGEFGRTVSVLENGRINIRGGTFSSDISARAGSVVEITGLLLLLDDLPIPGLVPGEPLTISDTDKVLSGLLADGTPFEFALSQQCARCPFLGVDPGATLTVTHVIIPEPAGVVLCLGGLAAIIYVQFFNPRPKQRANRSMAFAPAKIPATRSA